MEKNKENKYIRKVFYDIKTVKAVPSKDVSLFEIDRCEQLIVNDNVLGETRSKNLVTSEEIFCSEDTFEEISPVEAENYLKCRVKSWYEKKDAKPRGYFASNNIYNVPRHTEFSVCGMVMAECVDNECWTKKDIVTLPDEEESIYVSMDILAKSMETSKEAIHQFVLNSSKKEDVKKLQKVTSEKNV